MAHLDVTAAVLAGGESRRMGTDKALLRTEGGTTWIERIVLVARNRSSRTMIITGPKLRYGELFDSRTAEVFPDDPDVRGKGPLAGLVTALRKTTTKYLLCLTCDMPNVNDSAIEELGFPGEGEILRSAEKQFFPMMVRVNSDTLRIAEEEIRTNRRSVQNLLENVSARTVKIRREEAIRQFNTPEEVQSAKGSV
jgi:molybdopterin-guanine dinucleotide biosynthesis protein A